MRGRAAQGCRSRVGASPRAGTGKEYSTREGGGGKEDHAHYAHVLFFITITSCHSPCAQSTLSLNTLCILLVTHHRECNTPRSTSRRTHSRHTSQSAVSCRAGRTRPSPHCCEIYDRTHAHSMCYLFALKCFSVQIFNIFDSVVFSRLISVLIAIHTTIHTIKMQSNVFLKIVFFYVSVPALHGRTVHQYI